MKIKQLISILMFINLLAFSFLMIVNSLIEMEALLDPEKIEYKGNINIDNISFIITDKLGEDVFGKMSRYDNGYIKIYLNSSLPKKEMIITCNHEILHSKIPIHGGIIEELLVEATDAYYNSKECEQLFNLIE